MMTAVNQMFLLAQEDVGGGIAALACGTLPLIVMFALMLVAIAGIWKTFEKAGKPGWAAIVPIYNIIVLLEIVGKPLWWIVLFFIPCINIIAPIIIGIEMAKVFGKDAGYGIGLGLLPFIFYPLLGFSDAQYTQPEPQ